MVLAFSFYLKTQSFNYQLLTVIQFNYQSLTAIQIS